MHVERDTEYGLVTISHDSWVVSVTDAEARELFDLLGRELGYISIVADGKAVA